jgi:hypothetical protein
MAGDLATMKARIASEIARSDLTTQIASAITDAIGIYQKERFRFNEAVPDDAKSFQTVAGQAIYTANDLADIATVQSLDYLLMQVGVTLFALKREDPEIVRMYNQTSQMMGQPGWFAYEGNELILAAIPDKAYTIILGGYFVAPAPASDDEVGNKWMTDAERLIRARAKYEIACHVTRNAKMKQDMSPDAPEDNGGMVGATYREERLLKAEANRITGRGIIRPMQF